MEQASKMMPTPAILMKEETDSSQGIPQLLSDISACQEIAEAVNPPWPPWHGQDIVNGQGKATVSNEGATMLELLHVIHLMAKSSVDIAKFQYAEAGDGTTSVTLQLSGETPHGGRFAPTDRWSSELSALPPSWQLTRPRDCCDGEGEDKVEQRKLLAKCTLTALSSQLIS